MPSDLHRSRALNKISGVITQGLYKTCIGIMENSMETIIGRVYYLQERGLPVAVAQVCRHVFSGAPSDL